MKSWMTFSCELQLMDTPVVIDLQKTYFYQHCVDNGCCLEELLIGKDSER